MRLSILLLCYFHGTCWTSAKYCTYQPNTLYMKEGDSATIPCTYTYPEYWRGNSQIIVIWGEADGPNCYSIRKLITDSSGNIIDEYKDQISTVHHPGNRTASILIRGLKASDGVRLCCNVTVFPIDHPPFAWFDLDGTFITFAGGRWLSQVEELMAVSGEEMIIPCYYPMETMGEAQEVTWYTGDSKLCIYTENRIIYIRSPTHVGNTSRFSLVSYPEDVSLRILSIQRDEYSYFCCRVTTSNGIMENRYGTELSIAGSSSSSSFSVTQPDTITGHRRKSVTLSCSYSRDRKSNVLGVNIYWRVGSITGPYVYHPYKEMVHPNYTGRTEIKGVADLHIWGLQMSDNSTYYCFVMLRLCTESYKVRKLIQYGKETRLTVTGESHPSSIILTAVIYLGVKSLIFLVLFILSLLYLKRRSLQSDEQPYINLQALET